jgi:hypothetical protein
LMKMLPAIPRTQGELRSRKIAQIRDCRHADELRP